MRIVYNLRDQNWETTKSLGVLHVSLRILEGLAALPGIERIDVLANRSLAGLVPPSSAAAGVCRYHGLATPAPSGWSRLIWDQWSVVRQTNALQPDWLLLPKGFAPLVRWPHSHVSAYVHDNIFSYYKGIDRNPFPRGEMVYFSRSLARTASRVDVVVTNSAFTAREFERTHRTHARAVPIGAPVQMLNPQFGSEPGKSLLLLTSAWPHKLTGQAIAWLERWQTESRSDRPIHGVGSLSADVAWPNRAGWHHHARTDEGTFTNLRRRSAALIYFSAYEGYGLPPVEAATEGLAAIASDLPPLRETMPAACLFSNNDFESFRATLNRALQSSPVLPLRSDTQIQVAERWLAALGQCRRVRETI